MKNLNWQPRQKASMKRDGQAKITLSALSKLSIEELNDVSGGAPTRRDDDGGGSDIIVWDIVD